MSMRLQSQALQNPLAKTPKPPAGSPKFGSLGSMALPMLSQGRGLVNAFDFTTLGASAVPQNQLIYGMVIGSRAAVGATRSMNEVREVLLRDTLGWSFWFYATPIILRLYLMGVTAKNPVMKQALLLKNPAPVVPEGLTGFRKIVAEMKAKLYHLNPIQLFDMPSPTQLEQVKKMTVEELKAGAKEASPEALKKSIKLVEDFYNRAVVQRNLATGLGIAITIGLLGIGIQLINFYLTRKNIEQKRAAMAQGAQPQPAETPQPGVPTEPILYRLQRLQQQRQPQWNPESPLNGLFLSPGGEGPKGFSSF